MKPLDNSLVSTIPVKENMILRKAKEETNPGSTIFQYRYVAAIFGFLMFFQISCLRIAASMSVVKMVNGTAVNFHKNFNGTIDSCPLNDSAIEEFTEQIEAGEFNWSPQIQGYVLSAGYLGYVVCQIPGGMLAESYGAKRMFIIGVVLQSVAHMMCPFAAWYNCYLMIAMQFLRGSGQGIISPTAFVIAAKWFPRPERGFLNSCIFQGLVVGSLVCYPVSGALCSSTLLNGWPLVYFVYGVLGLVFGLCAHLFLYESPKEHPTIGNAELIYILENLESDLSQKQPPTPWRKILTSVPVYVMTFGVFADMWVHSHQLAVHPIFLANILHIPIQTNGLLNSLPFAFQIMVVFLGSWISKWLNTKGYVGVDKLRKGCAMIFSLGYSVFLLGTYFAGCDRVWSNICSTIAFIFAGFSVPGALVVPTDMSPTFAGSLFAFSNTFGSASMFIFPLILGEMTEVEESLEQWKKIFVICIAVVMSSGILFCVFGSADVQPWNFPSTEDVRKNLPNDEVMKIRTIECTLPIEMSTYL